MKLYAKLMFVYQHCLAKICENLSRKGLFTTYPPKKGGTNESDDCNRYLCRFVRKINAPSFSDGISLLIESLR